MGVVGCGRWGRNLVRNFRELGSLAAVCDRNADAREACAGGEGGTPAFADADELVRSGEVDAVAIATPSESHAAIAEAAIGAGLHVFVEKPMTTDLAAARSLAAAAGAAGLRLATGHLLLYHPAFQALAGLAEGGRLGEVRNIAASRLNAGAHAAGEDALWEFAPHDVAMVLSLAGGPPSSVFCSARVDGGGRTEHAHATLSFGGRLHAHILAARSSPTKEQRLVVHGSGGTAVFDDVAAGGEKLLLYPEGAETGEPVPHGTEEPLAAECAAFLAAVAEGAPLPSGPEESLEVMAVLDACFRSMREGKAVPPSTGAGP